MAELTADAWRPAAELGLLLADPVFWGWGVPRGDGHPVLVLPGLLGGDLYLEPLRGWLARIGYRPIRSGLERNPGWSEELVAELGDRAEAAYERYGRPVTILGHSLGGVQGRSIAVRRPHLLRQVITMGSPIAWSRSRMPAAVPLTSIFSREDRIVRYPAAVSRDPTAKNIEVSGSHTGLAFNPEVYRHLVDLLRAPARAPGNSR